MKKKLLLILTLLCCVSITFAQSSAHFHLKGGMQQTLELEAVDSITYLAPQSDLLLPPSCTVQAGTKVKLTYMATDGLLENPIKWVSSDSRIATFNGDSIQGKKQGKCIISGTYNGVTSHCMVTVTPDFKGLLEQIITNSPLVCYTAAEVGAYMSQALTTGSKSQTGSYPHRQGWDFMHGETKHTWKLHNTYIRPNYKAIVSNENNAKNCQLIATTLYLHSLMLNIDMYGIAPIYNSPDVVLPVYTSADKVYPYMDSIFTALLQNYENPAYTGSETNVQLTTTQDRIFEGDLNKWNVFTKALYARFLLRKLPNWENNATTCQKIISLTNEVLANWNEPRYYYPGGVAGNNCPWGPYAPSVNFWTGTNNILDESIPTTFFLHGLLGSIDGTYQVTRGYALDPRASRMMTARDQIAGMLHLESNIGMPIANTITSYPSLLSTLNPYTIDTGYIALMTTEEVMFIKAEAQYWSGNIVDAYATTVEATKASMQRYGISDAALAESNLKNQYNRFFEIKLPAANKFTIADLMQQKYVAMYLQPEQWTDMRRYNYSSSYNGISYDNVYIYDVKNVHNGVNALFAKDNVNYTRQYTLHRPYNLYEAHWCTEEDYGVNALLSPNAWVTKIPVEITAEYNQNELMNHGYYTTDESGAQILNYQILKQRIIWAHNTSNKATSLDANIAWK